MFSLLPFVAVFLFWLLFFLLFVCLLVVNLGFGFWPLALREEGCKGGEEGGRGFVTMIFGLLVHVVAHS